METLCRTHKREIAWFCSDCSVVICAKCLMEHKHHCFTEIESCEGVAAHVTAVIASDMSDAVSAVNTLQAQLDQYKPLRLAIDTLCRSDYLAAEQAQESAMRVLSQRFQSAHSSQISDAALAYLLRAKEVIATADKENEAATMKVRAALATFPKVKNVKDRLQKCLALTSLAPTRELPPVPTIPLQRATFVCKVETENWSVEEQRVFQKLT